MKRILPLVALGAGVFTGGLSGWLPPNALANDWSVLQPADAGKGSLQAMFPVPPPVLTESPPAALYGGGMPHTHCLPCDPPTACPRTHVGYRWHYRTKPCLQASHWGYAEFFQDRPFGSYVNRSMATHIDNGLAAQLVLYRYDFVTPDGRAGLDLNTSGRIRLERLLHLASLTACPIIIQLEETNPDLSLEQRNRVLASIQQLAPDFPEDRLVVGRPAARGLAGTEAVAIQRNVEQQVQYGAMQSFSGGVNAGVAPGSAGSTGTTGAVLTPGTGF